MYPTVELCNERRANGPVFAAEPPVTPSNVEDVRKSLQHACYEIAARLSSSPMTETMTYALAGGKCLRGLLLIAIGECCGVAPAHTYRAAAGVEMLHAASLVVDDLPALDNAPVRRGVPSLHARFGEAAAILTGHALVAGAFELLAEAPAPPDRMLRAVRLFAAAIGGRGMARAEMPGSPNLQPMDMRALKTGVLFEAAAAAGATIAGASAELTGELGLLGMNAGVLYQLADDLRDDVLTSEERTRLTEQRQAYWTDCRSRWSHARPLLRRTEPLEHWMTHFRAAGIEADAA